MENRVSEDDVEGFNTVKSDGLAVVDTAEVNVMNAMFAYRPRRSINQYSRNRVNKTYNFVFESKQSVQNISQSKEKIILFGIMR